MMREFGVVITAVLLAGRTNSAFTAEIGAMKMRQEIDAMRVIGIEPMEALVAPRVVAMLVMTPILTFAADDVGYASAACLCAGCDLGVSPVMFFARVAEGVPAQHFWVGIVEGAGVRVGACRSSAASRGFRSAATSARSGRRVTTFGRASHLHGDPARRAVCALVPGDGPVSEEIAIRVRGLVTRFGEQTVHDGLDLDVKRGEILGVVGPSGTGKSVLLREIVAPRQADRGRDRVSRFRGSGHEPRLGVMFQDGALFSNLTVLENVEAPLREHTHLSPHAAH